MIHLRNVSKVYPNGHVAVQDLNLHVGAGEVCVLVGPSGCGKTTTMRMVNRLIEPSAGTIEVAGQDIARADPVELRRHIGYVIQSVGLFPHQTIAQNVATVPRLLGWPKPKVAARVDELLELVGLDPSVFRDRYPAQLSGGQQQRVGVARALGADPPVLLMDEPFGAIDPITRDRLQQEFLRLQAELRKTVVFVTHDVEEAVRLGDHIAVMAEGGVLAQHATPAELLARPADAFVRGFLGTDRGLRLLAVTPIGPGDLRPLDGPPPPVAVALGSPLRSALDRMVVEQVDELAVVDGDGRVLGRLTWAAFVRDRSAPEAEVTPR